MPSVFDLLWPIALLLATVWALRIWRLNLVRRYPFLFTYLVLIAPLHLLGYFLYGSDLRVWDQKVYNLFWVAITPLHWILCFAVVFELYGHMLRKYVGVRRLGRLVLYGGLITIGAGVAVLIYVDPYQIPNLDRWKALWLRHEQGVYLAIAALIFILLIFKKAFSLALTKNVQLVVTSFGLYFCGIAALLVIRTFVGSAFKPVRDLVSMILYVGCLALGGILFSQRGEADAAELSSDSVGRGQMATRAAQQLQSFNDRLVRVLHM